MYPMNTGLRRPQRQEKANPYAVAPMANYQTSPFLNQQIGQVGQQINQDFLRNTLPAIRSNSIGAGGFGGSRQGIAEGLGAEGAQRAYAQAATGLLGQDYQADRARALAKFQGDQGYSLGIRGQDTQKSIAQMNNATQMHGINSQTGLGYAGLQNQMGIAGMQNATQRYLGDQSTGLGYAGLNQQRYNTDAQTGLGYAGLNTQRDIAGMNNATSRYGIDSQANIAQGQLGLGYTQAANQYNLGREQNANNRYGIDANNSTQRYGYDTQAGTQRYGYDTQRNIAHMNDLTTQRGQNNTFMMADADRAQRDRAMRDSFYLGNRGQDITQLGIGANLYGDTLRTLAATGQQGGSNNGFNWQGALGGLLGGMQFGKNMGWGW
jgi:hypothetical protein